MNISVIGEKMNKIILAIALVIGISITPVQAADKYDILIQAGSAIFPEEYTYYHPAFYQDKIDYAFQSCKEGVALTALNKTADPQIRMKEWTHERSDIFYGITLRHIGNRQTQKYSCLKQMFFIKDKDGKDERYYYVLHRWEYVQHPIPFEIEPEVILEEVVPEELKEIK